ncbi:GNAT family N-acetyltransferase [Acuticoccus sp. MNP-M23]|uniref:GNAT family N-acetyltransferase n=1 Tax=Acuticoccus sp. MNP-M23 TaxID=3072793 RepID=UPI002814A9A2|nr:GNAT family N-acetyltransferase [Acuticoccus sp. MNP-M23]WMS43212.1 GNAT family N-acetyltransferase [Acuticoccus sp. MNP-M23]
MPLSLVPPMRLATAADGVALAELVNFAGEGLPLYLWNRLSEPGQDPWALGAERQAKMAADGRIVVVDEGAGVVAALTGYPVHEEKPLPEDMPPMWRVLQELENQVVGTWYLNVLATYPRARGRGLGAQLIKHAEKIARFDKLSGVSIIVADENVGALRLYERLGYAEIDRKPMIKETWDNPSDNWILLKKDLAA